MGVLLWADMNSCCGTAGAAGSLSPFRRCAIGSEMSGGMENITIEDCDFTQTETGLNIKYSAFRGGYVQGIHYRNIVMGNQSRAALTVNSGYGSKNPSCGVQKAMPCPVGSITYARQPALHQSSTRPTLSCCIPHMCVLAFSGSRALCLSVFLSLCFSRSPFHRPSSSRRPPPLPSSTPKPCEDLFPAASADTPTLRRRRALPSSPGSISKASKQTSSTTSCSMGST